MSESEPYPASAPLALETLSDLQMVIVHGLVNGRTIVAMVRTIGRPRSTVVTHMQRAFKRLGVRNQRELIIRYWRDTETRICTADELRNGMHAE
jgi:DNA-binding NarL/FixJ family response regulator